MVESKLLNKDILSNKSLCNRRKAIEILLYGGSTNNKAVQNIINCVNQQTLDYINLREYIKLKSRSFHDIYNVLQEYKKGIIPVIISCVIKDCVNYTVIEKNKKEIKLTPNLFEEIEKNPSDYTIKIVNKTEEYESLYELFHSYEGYNIFESITRSMQDWFFGTSKYARIINNRYICKGKYKKINSTTLKFKEILGELQENPYYFVSNKLVALFGENWFKILKSVKEDVDNEIELLKATLRKDINDIFNYSLTDWYNNLSDHSRQRLYLDDEDVFLNICKNAKNNCQLIEDLSQCLTGLKIEDWEDNTPGQFYLSLNQMKSEIELTRENKFNCGYKIIHVDERGEHIEKLFDVRDKNKSPDIKKLLRKDIECLINDYKHIIPKSNIVETILDTILEFGGVQK